MLSYVVLVLIFLVQNVFAYNEVCVVGDTGTGTQAQYQVAEAMNKANCKDIIHTGDVFYERGVQSEVDSQWATKFEDPFSILIQNGAQFFITMGNHDHSAGKSDKIKRIHQAYASKSSFYRFPNLYYDFKLAKTCFWAIDSDRFDTEQAKDIEKSIKSTKGCDWKIVFGHHPVISSGVHGDAKPKSYIRKNLEPILSKNVDIYFAGHDHNLADEGFYPDNGGFRQIISGAGAKLRPVKSCNETGCDFSVSKLGFVKAYFSDNSVIIDFMDVDLNILYSATLNK